MELKMCFFCLIGVVSLTLSDMYCALFHWSYSWATFIIHSAVLNTLIVSFKNMLFGTFFRLIQHFEYNHRLDIVVDALRSCIEKCKVGKNLKSPLLTPPVCNDSLKPPVAWGVWIGISPDRARLSICSFSTVKMLFLKCTLEENSRRLKRRRIELWRLLQS